MKYSLSKLHLAMIAEDFFGAAKHSFDGLYGLQNPLLKVEYGHRKPHPPLQIARAE